ncbi:hypothetical protein EPO15_03205 [bacterium]|nr:MAG: hypothetical protein EPO15_03205 [bacterium]
MERLQRNDAMRLPSLAAVSLCATAALGPVWTCFGAPRPFFDKWTYEEIDIRRGVRKAERAELVRPAPKGFKPEPVARKLKLTLIARDKTIREEESFWYRLELQNVGREAVRFRESPSFLKDGRRYDDGRWEFYMVRPNGKKERIPPSRLADVFEAQERPHPPIDVPDSENMTKEQVSDWIHRDGLRRTAETNLEVVLAPGETLVSRPWRWVEPEEQKELYAKGAKDLWPKPSGEFRELRTSAYWEPLGNFKIWVAYDDPPRNPPDEEELQRMEKKGVSRAWMMKHHSAVNAEALGRIESNIVALEVTK